MGMQGNPLGSICDVIDGRAARYDRENPEVWQEFERLALELIRRGVQHYGAKAVMEVVRYHRTVGSNDPHFKVNNSFTSYYARQFARRYPKYREFFDMRRSRYDAAGPSDSQGDA